MKKFKTYLIVILALLTVSACKSSSLQDQHLTYSNVIFAKENIATQEYLAQNNKTFKKGDKVSARILVVDIEKERISLGIKQLTENPSGETASVGSAHKKNEVLTCKVTAVDKDGIEVEITEGVTSYIKRNELSRDRQDQRPERFAVGDRVDQGLEPPLGLVAGLQGTRSAASPN